MKWMCSLRRILHSSSFFLPSRRAFSILNSASYFLPPFSQSFYFFLRLFPRYTGPHKVYGLGSAELLKTARNFVSDSKTRSEEQPNIRAMSGAAGIKFYNVPVLDFGGPGIFPFETSIPTYTIGSKVHSINESSGTDEGILLPEKCWTIYDQRGLQFGSVYPKVKTKPRASCPNFA